MNTEERVTRIVAEQLGVNWQAVGKDEDLELAFSADSLDWFETIMAIEDKFGFDIPDEDAEPIRTVQQISDYINKRII